MHGGMASVELFVYWYLLMHDARCSGPPKAPLEALICTITVDMVYFTLTDAVDLCDVLTVICDLNDWKELGLQLGLLYYTLERIDLEQHGRIAECKKDMLSAWLQQQDNVLHKGTPSWNVLRVTLKRMGENEIAERILSL